MADLITGEDGLARCWWAGTDPAYIDYHDTEWGFGHQGDNHLFEKLCLEGFQSGLSWLTILRKRNSFRNAFAGFDPDVVATYGDAEVEKLLNDASIVRHQGKIRSTINNATRARELRDEHGSLAAYFAPHFSTAPPPEEIPAQTPTSRVIAKDLKRRGWSFVGPTTVYAFLQSVGLVNDHHPTCWVRDRSEDARLSSWDAS